MKSLFNNFCRLSFLIITLLAISSCKKDNSIDEQSEKVYPVSFNITSFTKSSNYLKTAVNKSSILASNSGNQGYTEGFLYFWSFNSESLAPDIKYRNTASTSIIYNTSTIPQAYVGSTFAFDNYVAGKALNITGGREFYVKMDIKDVDEIIRFGFDIGSTNTGPKDFEIYYSVDNGINYNPISLENQFSFLTAGTKNSYVFELSNHNIKAEQFWIKMVMKEGDRVLNGSSVGTYSATSGIFRIDNIYLVGIAPPLQSANTINKLQYFLFNKDKPSSIYTGQVDLTNEMNLSFDLPLGKYEVFFISNSSNKEIILPTIIDLSTFYVSNLFDNAVADIFGYVSTIDVFDKVTADIELKRLYSQIKVEFTDAVNLDKVKRIIVSQEHEPFYYSPFVTGLSNPILDQSSIEFEDDFQANKQILFNQFMGNLVNTAAVNYNVEVYGVNDLLRKFTLSSNLKNNMQLVFRGDLLRDVTQQSNFVIKLNENWDGQNTTNF